VTFVGTPAFERAPKLSPDGNFLAYVSNETGRNEVYVRPFPRGEGRWQASVNGGTQPRWRGDGKELFYVEGEGALMAAQVETEPTFALGRTQRLFESEDFRSATNLPNPQYAVSVDGQRFLTSTPVETDDKDEPAAPVNIHVVENWYEEFTNRDR